MKSYKLAFAFAAMLLISGWTSQVARAEDDEDEYEITDRAHLIVRKFVKDELVVQGRNVTVTVDIFNSGVVSAKDVKVKDTLPESATLIEGALEASFDRIAEGSHAQLVYTIVFSSGGSGLALPLAIVTYKADDATTQTGHSTTMGLFVMTPVQQITRYALVAGSYISLGMARTPADWRNIVIVLGLVGGLLGGNAAMKSFTSSSTNRKRQRALQELEKDQ